MRRSLLMLSMLLVAVAAPAGAAPMPTLGYLFPESVYFDPASGDWFISNFGPSPAPDTQDTDGFISRLDADGTFTQQWVTGLGSPKGLRAHDGKLYVADVRSVIEIDITSGAITRVVDIEGAELLNDLDVDDTGTVYVTDWLGNAIYTVSPAGTVSLFLASPDLEAPNGILVEGGTLTLATWGTNINPDLVYTTDEPGRILFVDIASKVISALGSGERIGGLDGIERDGHSYLVTDWAAGRVLRVATDGTVTEVLRLPPSTADLGFDAATNRIGVPVFLASTVVFDTAA